MPEPVPPARLKHTVTSDGRPVGLQIAGAHRADAAVLRAAANYEAARPWADAKPALNTAP